MVQVRCCWPEEGTMRALGGAAGDVRGVSGLLTGDGELAGPS